MASCTNLEAALKLGNHSDVIGDDDLCFELMVLKEALPRYYKRPLEVLNFLKRREEGYPNSLISYQILFDDFSFSRYCSKKNFFKLKLINSYMRSIMSQEMLNGLAIISIDERKLVKNLDYEIWIKKFIEKYERNFLS